VREGIRKPFIIYEYMYSNAIRTADSGLLNQEGVLAWAPWTVLAVGGTSEAELTPEQRGEALFRAQCLRCHTLDGFNGIKPLIKRWPENSIRHALENLHVEQYYMPPFFGPEKDLEELTRYLLSLNQGEAAPQSNGKITANG